MPVRLWAIFWRVLNPEKPSKTLAEKSMTTQDSPDTDRTPTEPRQPLAVGEKSAAAKGRQLFDVHIYRDWCKSCGICAALCPKQVLSRNEEGSPVVTDPDACIGCGWCELHCPDFAISVRARPEEHAGEDEG